MLSIENHSDPSCSFNATALRSDEEASDKLAFQEAADPVGFCEAQPPRFSIRDYVLKSRSKDITTSWPFRQKILRLCLKHGAKDVLPPFEPPNLVRDRCCCINPVEPEQPVACSIVEQNPTGAKSFHTDDADQKDVPNGVKHELCLPSDQTRHSLPKLEISKKVVLERIPGELKSSDVSTVTSQDRIEKVSGHGCELACLVHVNRSAAEASSDLESAGPSSSQHEKVGLRCEPSEKECRLTVKLGGTSEALRSEDVASTSTAVSDLMASKACPVCKKFTSTSNTTLNAHIDQCLSLESNAKRAINKLSKHKVKPRKKRLMVDIYTTAEHCTLEDLDRRNGTNWATDLSLLPRTNAVGAEIKRPKLSSVDITDDGNAGAVYVDSNGTKLRILSKFSDSPTVMSNDLKLKKHSKGVKAGRINKKKHFKSKYSKYIKINQQIKKSSSFKLLKSETEAAEDEDSEILNSNEQVNSNGPATLRQWVCSKRSGFLRKLKKENVGKSFETNVPIARNPSLESSRPNSDQSSLDGSHILKFSRSIVDPSSVKMKSVDVLSNTVRVMDHGKKSPHKLPEVNSSLPPDNISLAKGLKLKLSRSSKSSFSSPRSKRKERNLGIKQNPDNFSDMRSKPSKSCNPLLKAKKSSMLKKDFSLEGPSLSKASIHDEVQKRLTNKKFYNHRSVLATGKQEGELSSGVDRGLHISSRDLGFDSAELNKAGNSHESDFSENVTMLNSAEDSDGVPSQGREDLVTIEKQKCPNQRLHSVTLHHNHDAEASDMQCEALACGINPAKKSIDEAVNDPHCRKTVVGEDLVQVSSARLDGCVKSVCGAEAQAELSGDGLINEQEAQCGDEPISPNIPVVGEEELRVEEDLCAIRHGENPTGSASIQKSSTCLTGRENLGLEIPLVSSSATPARMMYDQDHNLAIQMETLPSPGSTVMTIPPSPPKDSKPRDSYMELLVKPTAAREKISTSLSNYSELPPMVTIKETEWRSTKRCNQKAKATAFAKESKKLSADQLCRCSHRSLLGESPQLLGQNIRHGTMLPLKGKQMASNFYSNPSMSASPGAFPSLRTDEMAPTMLNLPAKPILKKVSSDSAAKLPTYSDFSSPSTYAQAQTQAGCNPILRLMGKDLLVKKEEVAQYPLFLPSGLDHSLNTDNIIHGLTSANGVFKQVSFSYQHHHITGGSSVLGQPLKVNHHMDGTMGVPPQKSRQKKANKKLNSPSSSHPERMAAPHQHLHELVTSSAIPYEEVIMIDDSLGVGANMTGSVPRQTGSLPPIIPGLNVRPQRSFSSFPSQDRYAAMEVPGMVRQCYSISHPQANAHPFNQGSTSEGPNPLSSFVLKSPSAPHLTSALYYSPKLR